MDSSPVFAIVGHPNEGKSSVVATLSQNDAIAISATPGETTRLQRFELKAEGETVIAFVDTPGFQNPQATLSWFEEREELGESRTERFIAARQDDPDFHHDCELLRPIAEGAGIIYVVDASRPITAADIAEMEILRLTGRPRMALINPKSDERRFLDKWKAAFRQRFNLARVFDAQKAQYAERIELLEALKSIDQDWEPALKRAVELSKRDRKRAIERTAQAMMDHLEQALVLSCAAYLENESGVEAEKRRLEAQYEKKLSRIERRFRDQVREIYGVHRAQFELPPNSVLRENLRSERVWQALGLTQRQLAVAGATIGGGLGAGADLASGGVTFGVFAAFGAAVGAASALLKAKDLARAKIRRLPLGGLKVSVGLGLSEQFPFVQLDRFLLYARFAANWSHARQEAVVELEAPEAKGGPTSAWTPEEVNSALRFIRAAKKDSAAALEETRPAFKEVLAKHLSS